MKKNIFTGLSQTTTSATGTSLTEKDFEKATKYFRSKRYQKKLRDQELAYQHWLMNLSEWLEEQFKKK